MIKVTSDETKVEILKSLDFNHAEIRDLKEKIVAQASNVHMETYMRRCNLIFEGCKEQEKEKIYAVIVNIITNVLKLQMDPGACLTKYH